MTDKRIIGLMAYFSLATQHRLAKDSSLTPTAQMEIELAEMSAQAYQNFSQISALATQLEVDIAQGISTYIGLTEALEARLRPTDWYERLVKSYITVGVMADFNEHLHFFLSEQAKAQLPDLRWDCGQGQWAIPHIKLACQTQETVPSRLSLWGRRVVGDVISTLRQALANHPDILGGDDIRGMENLTQKIRSNHRERMIAASLKA